MNANAPLPPRARQTPPRKTSATPKKKKPKRRKWVVALLSFFAVVILGLGLFAGYLYLELNKTLNDIALPEGPDSKPIASADSAQVKPVSMVLLGLDSREGTGTLNTDVLMVAAFNPKSNTATVVSIPRDSLLDIDGYKQRKANAYYANFYAGKRDEGLSSDDAYTYARSEMRDMFGEFFGVPFDYTAIINFKGFSDVVDALGGIKVYVDQDMYYTDSADGTKIDLKKGEQTLDGEDALGFVRYRKSKGGRTPESSDFARNDRQARVLAAITDEMKSLGGVTKLGKVISAVGDNMTTDIPREQITNLLKAYYDLDSSQIRFIPLEGSWRSPYVYLNDSSVEKAKAALAEELSPEGRQAGAATPSAAG
ncbi:LCP family protein [Cohnella massiliensis]|uniref:LCP family protein n=1 Tax=Cohnella massiliensis TaxID=1816691 RepID=UPI0009BB6389|nr:LCP family protein [Cohnella massiliensis]